MISTTPMEIRISTSKGINIFLTTMYENLKNQICINSSEEIFYLKDVFLKNISSNTGQLLYFEIE